MTPKFDERDRGDRILPVTRWASWAVVGVLVPSLLILWGFPGYTRELWAWTITPEMTAVFMGAAYGAGAFFFARVAQGGPWHPASAGVLAASIFALLMLIVTILHWQELNGGRGAPMAVLSFYAWTVVYVVSPFAVFAIWWRNRAAASRERTRASAPPLPAGFRRSALAVATGAMGLGGLMFLAPSAVMGKWPWELSALTARVIGCFTIQLGIGALILSRDLRWSAWHLLVQTLLLATVLQLLGAIRVWGSFRSGFHGAFVLSALLASGIALAYLQARMARRHSASPARRSGR